MLSDLAVLAFQLFMGAIVWGLFVGCSGFVVYCLFTRGIPQICFPIFMFIWIVPMMLMVAAGFHGGHLEVWFVSVQVLFIQYVTQGPLTYHVFGFGLTNVCPSECKTSVSMMGSHRSSCTAAISCFTSPLQG